MSSSPAGPLALGRMVLRPAKQPALWTRTLKLSVRGATRRPFRATAFLPRTPATAAATVKRALGSTA
eukprot:9462453-Karenia_brevis.AAC.1